MRRSDQNATRPGAAHPKAHDVIRGRDFVQGFERGVAVIKAFSVQSRFLSVGEVARRTRLTRAVARRYLLTLESLGYIARDDSRFALTPRVLELGFAYLSTVAVVNVARPFMQQIVDTLHESCSIGMLDGHDVVYVARMQAQRIMTTNLAVGSRLPAHATSLGKVLLAYLPPAMLDAYFATAPLEPLTDGTITDEQTLRAVLESVRRRGWSENDQESEKGVRTVAVPIAGEGGAVVAAINLSAHASRVTMRLLRRDYLPALQSAAADISKMLVAPRTREPATPG